MIRFLDDSARTRRRLQDYGYAIIETQEIRNPQRSFYIEQRKRYSSIAEYSACTQDIDWPFDSERDAICFGGHVYFITGASGFAGQTVQVALMNNIVNLSI